MALVIYSSRTGRIRRIITDDNPARTDQILRHKYPPRAGESAELMAGGAANNDELNDLQRRLNQVTGKLPQNDRYVVLNGNGVVNRIFRGDPDAGDVFPNRTVLQDNKARRRWRRNIANTSWERSVREINHALNMVERRRTRLNSQTWFDDKLADGRTEAEIQIELAERNAQLDTRLANLNTEKATRQGPRP